ncbi:MAG: M20/M25/M40 family metallo-hydrolase [Deltaproteobacteria bacterium]|nr:M20/M25/M40 family metallo-hydrolase [Deltaproteobacteria bacterium]
MPLRAFALLALAGCVSPSRADPAPSCVDDGTPYARAGLHARLAVLGGAELDGRAPGSAGDVTARKVIAERLTCLGLTPIEQVFTAQNGKETANVYAVLPGSDPDVGSEIILVSAHHDHLGKGYFGANDNASGVVAMLAIAQDMVQRKAAKRTIVFAAFGDEETGMTGSYYFAGHMPADVPMAKIVQVINLDMVGSHSSRGFVAAMGTFKGFAATKHLAKLTSKYPRLNVGTGGTARGSDFEPFCKQRIPYVFFWTPDARCYHEKCDTVERIDEKRMVDIASLAGDLVRALADSELDLSATQQRLGCGVKYPRAS